MEEQVTHGEIFEEFCANNREFASNIIFYRPWGSTSIVVWTRDGHIFKVKRTAPNLFVMQRMSEEDVNKRK